MSDFNVRLPADGTGKRVHVAVHLEIDYASGTIDFVLGDQVTCVTSGVSGEVVRITGTTASGEVYILLDHESPEAVTNGENIQVNAVTNAVTSGTGIPFYTQTNILSGGNNPMHTASVDVAGSLYTRFAEGSPQFDAFGKLQVSEQTTLAEYIHKYDVLPDKWYNIVASSATITHEADTSGVILSCPTTSGASAQRTTHLYHPYQAGFSQLSELTIAVGDTGKTNVDRYWGYYDNSDGIFFRLTDSTFQIGKRSSVTGSVVPTYIAQSAWNKDRLDGTGSAFNLSGKTLDVSKDNIYWIDLQWLGAGRVRFGVIIDGVRITCHEMYHANLEATSFIKTGQLPLRVEQINTGTAASTSELRLFCATVKSEGKFDPDAKHLFKHIRSTENQDGGVYKKEIFNYHPGRPLMSVRPKTTVNSVTNRRLGLPHHMSFSNFSSDHVNITARRGATITNSTWESLHSESAFEFDDKGEIDVDNRGTQTAHWMVGPNQSINLDLTKEFSLRKEKIILGADGTDQNTFSYSFTAYNMSTISSNTSTLSFDGSNNNITQATGNFVASGYTVGQGLHVQDSTSNDGYYKLSNVTDLVLEAEYSNGAVVSFTNEASTANVAIQAGDTSQVFAGFNILEVQ